MLAHGFDAVDEVARAAIAKIVAVDARDDDVSQLERGDRPREIRRLVNIQWQGPAMTDVAERAAPPADIPPDHRGRGALGKALADVGARRLLANRMEVVLAQDFLDLSEARRGRGTYPNPFRLPQPFHRHDAYRAPRKHAARLGLALVLDARRI